jgi:LSD1 subclass zinc finger protein
MTTEKKDCYIFWDEEVTKEEDRQVYIQCDECFKKNRKGFKWDKKFLHGRNEIKCSFCNTIIYKRGEKN